MAKLIVGILGLILGLIALIIGWMSWVGFILGIPAILLAGYAYEKGAKVLGILGIFFASIGIVGSFLMVGTFPDRLVIEKELKEMQEKITPVGLTGKVGESIKLDGLSLTVNSVKTSDKHVYEMFGRYGAALAKSGYHFVTLDITLKNVGVKEERPDVWNILLITDKGYLYERKSSSSIAQGTNRTTREVAPEERDRLYCKELELFEGIPAQGQIRGCWFFEILSTHAPAKLEFRSGIAPGKLVSIEL